MKRYFVIAFITLAIIIQFGCSQDEEQPEVQNPTIADVSNVFNGAPLVGEVVLEPMYEAEVSKLATKTRIEVITAIEGTSKVAFEAEFRRIQPSGFGFPLYECVLTDEAVTAMGGVAQGMSGSPVGPPGRVFGALAYGDAWAKAPYRFLVTPIEAMEATINHTTFGDILNPPAAPGGGIKATFTKVKTPVTISGVDNNRLQQLSDHLSGTHFDSVQFFSRIGGAPVAPPANATLQLSAGDMIGVAIATGDVVNSIGFGTVTQVYDGNFVAFGHDMFRAGKVSLPVYRAVVDGIVPNTEIAYKSASAYGNPIGTITKDLRPGIVGELGKLPDMIPVTVYYKPVNSQVPIQKNHEVAYGQEWAIPVVVATTLDSIRMEVSPGTIEANVAISFKETDTVYTESFRTIAPDPFKAVLENMKSIIQPLSNILYNGAERATIDEVKISLIDIPYILHTEITDIHVVGEIKQGEEATFVVEMLPHWSAAGRNRKMYREVKLQIPENFIPGPARLAVTSATTFGFNPFGIQNAPSPESLDQLIYQLKDGQYDKGLVLVTLAALEDEPEMLDPEIEELFENFFEQFFTTLFENLPEPDIGEDSELPDNGELPEDGEMPDDSELPEDGELPDDGEMPDDSELPEDGELPDDGELQEEIEEPLPVPITGLPFIVNRFIVTGDTEIEVEVQPIEPIIDDEVIEPAIDDEVIEE